MRMTRQAVTFGRPFFLNAVDGVQPSGTYMVDEALIEGLSFLACRRVGTTIDLPLPHVGPGSIQAVRVDPHELEGALAMTAALPQVDG